ncbi:MAG: dihydropteroate synthase [Clostridiales bacterium]
MTFNLRLALSSGIGDLPWEMDMIGADQAGVKCMLPKAAFYGLHGEGLSLPGALILKQEALSKGCEAVIHRDCIVSQTDISDFLLLGTEKQLLTLCDKLLDQDFGLRKLSREIRQALENCIIKEWTLAWDKWQLDLGKRTLIMGIVNITPDSFSDGGKYFSAREAIDQALLLAEQGADIIDIGGASSRPGHQIVSAEEEKRRVLPVIEALSQVLSIPISIDSDKAQVVEAALEKGATIINDIGGLQLDEQMVQVAASHRVPVIAMHQGSGKDLMGNLTAYFRRTEEIAQAASLDKNLLIYDPGIGFGKSVEDNLYILNNLQQLTVLGHPLLLGTSNKSHIGQVLDLPVDRRDEGTAATVCASIAGGAAIIRVHNVEKMAQVAKMADALSGRDGKWLLHK